MAMTRKFPNSPPKSSPASPAHPTSLDHAIAMSFPPATFEPLLKKVAAHLLSNKQKISVAETAAGGLISASLLSVPGASGYFAGGVTLYTLPSRIAYAGWTEEDMKKYKYIP